MTITVTVAGDTGGEVRKTLMGLLGFDPVVECGPLMDQFDAARFQTRDAETTDFTDPGDETAIAPTGFGGDADPAPAPQTPQEGEILPPTPAKRRGRPPKAAAPVIENEPTAPPAETPETQPEADPVVVDAAGQEIVPDPLDDATWAPEVEPNPLDPAAGWTTEDARAAGRAFIAPMTDEEGRQALHKLLGSFGVEKVKDLPADRIVDFVKAARVRS
jgi:hypothetical protein